MTVTRVLNTSRWPWRASGRHHGPQLDALARYALWQAGLTTITAPATASALISRSTRAARHSEANIALQPGMIVSNEPGYYKHDAYGIRTRTRSRAGATTAPPPLPEFETLTLAPIDLACIEPGLLTDAERQWLNDYHRRARDGGPEIDEATPAWLAEATRAVALR
jgi:Xaa-Pro aminopeptidase